jgi:hypothetical protein
MAIPTAIGTSSAAADSTIAVTSGPGHGPTASSAARNTTTAYASHFSCWRCSPRERR